MSQDATHRASIMLVARLTGAAYLGFIVTSVVANVLGGIGLGSAADMQASIAAGGLGFRIGLTIAFVSALLFADGVAVTFWFLEALVIPTHPLITIPLTVISLAAELGISLWLLIRGISLKDASAGLQRSVTGSA
ncbi:MAG: hypothetical protein KF742_09255 [Cryobacterium sp.]|nr:hypothetical protein [Cryobacterium sp.]MBX3089432.1 hypothetical protein [Cryobacterium sp.]MBX3116775.1 hypothetical protein [Cryobacterium sp.]MCO5294696.1 hypothetical protein [Homoserinimonas sp.]MCW5944261.1 hypothetical protein [Cryobacterium sp.]